MNPYELNLANKYRKFIMSDTDSIILKVKFSDDYPFERTPPQYATPGAACVDFKAIEDMVLMNHSQITVRTGLHVEIPEGYCLKLYSRSGHGKHGVRLSNCVGIIDSDYRGEISIMLTSDSLRDMRVDKGTRIAQGMIEKVIPINWQVVDELSVTERGGDGFGSSN